MTTASGEAELPLHVEERGEGEDVLVLVHGFGASGFVWRRWAPELARDRRVLVLDLKGFGRAPKPRDDEYGPMDFAALVIRLVRQLDARSLTLVGHSLGGGICLLAALELLGVSGRLEAGGTPPGSHGSAAESERASRPAASLRRLVLVAPVAYPQAVPRYVGLAGIPVLGPLLLGLVPARTVARLALASATRVPGTVTPEAVDGYAETFRTRAGRRAVARAARLLLPPDLDRIVTSYGRIDVPTLLLWGREDPVVPVEVGRRLERDLPRARLEVLASCGHIPQEERPRESLGVVQRFLAET